MLKPDVKKFIMGFSDNFEDTFRLLDVQCARKLRHEDFAQGLSELGFTGDVAGSFSEIDKDGDGIILLRDFAEYFDRPPDDISLLHAIHNDIGQHITSETQSNDAESSSSRSTELVLSLINSFAARVTAVEEQCSLMSRDHKSTTLLARRAVDRVARCNEESANIPELLAAFRILDESNLKLLSGNMALTSSRHDAELADLQKKLAEHVASLTPVTSIMEEGRTECKILSDHMRRVDVELDALRVSLANILSSRSSLDDEKMERKLLSDKINIVSRHVDDLNFRTMPMGAGAPLDRSVDPKTETATSTTVKIVDIKGLMEGHSTKMRESIKAEISVLNESWSSQLNEVKEKMQTEKHIIYTRLQWLDEKTFPEMVAEPATPLPQKAGDAPTELQEAHKPNCTAEWRSRLQSTEEVSSKMTGGWPCAPQRVHNAPSPQLQPGSGGDCSNSKKEPRGCSTTPRKLFTQPGPSRTMGQTDAACPIRLRLGSPSLSAENLSLSTSRKSFRSPSPLVTQCVAPTKPLQSHSTVNQIEDLTVQQAHRTVRLSGVMVTESALAPRAASPVRRMKSV